MEGLRGKNERAARLPMPPFVVPSKRKIHDGQTGLPFTKDQPTEANTALLISPLTLLLLENQNNQQDQRPATCQKQQPHQFDHVYQDLRKQRPA